MYPLEEVRKILHKREGHPAGPDVRHPLSIEAAFACGGAAIYAIDQRHRRSGFPERRHDELRVFGNELHVRRWESGINEIISLPAVWWHC